MAFSHSHGIQINGSSFIDVRGNMHIHTSPSGGRMGLNASHHVSTPFNQPVVLKPVLPSRPRLVIGRAREIESLVDALLTIPAPRLAILGPGGMGKTTLALTVLHDGRLSPRWKRSRIYFVDCEGITSVELLVKELADVMRVPPSRRGFDVFDAVLHALAHQPVILCLDNFETPWDDLNLRPSIEEALQRLDGVQDLALLVTMRGIQLPAVSKINWLTNLPPLKQLDFEDAKVLFEQISHKMDTWSEQLVTAVDCIPLAVTLLAQLILEDTETTESLWDRWTKERTAVIENGGQDRLSKLDTSIELSLSKLDPSTGQILGMLALLPDGLVSSAELMDMLGTRIPNEINLKAGLGTLRRKALVFRSGNRYQMLSPIRYFTLQYSTVSIGVQRGLIKAYIAILLKHSDYSDATSYNIVRPEISNFRNILSLAFETQDIPDLSSAAIAYTYILQYNGLATADIIQRALNIPCLAPEAQADCFLCLGRLHLHWNELDDAEQSLKRALELHEQVQDMLGQASDHQHLGMLHMRRDELDDAEQSLKRALELHEQVQDMLGQANDHQELGVLYMRRDELDDAEESLKQALELHEQVQYILGQAYDHYELGVLHMRRNEFDNAEQSLKRALELHEWVQDLGGQGNDHYELGVLHMRQDELDAAEQSLNRALHLYEQIHYASGAAYMRSKLIILSARRSQT